MFNEEKHKKINAYWTIFANSDEPDDEAFASVYALSVDDVRAYGISLGVDEDTCQDLIHDIFCHLYMKRRQYALIRNFMPYLFRSFRNRVLNVCKNNRKYADVEVGNLPFAIDVTIMDTMIDDEERERIRLLVENLLEELTPRQREAIYLRYMLNLDYEEIGRQLDMNVESVRKLVYRAITSLRKKSGEMGLPVTIPFLFYLLSRLVPRCCDL